MNEWIVEIDRVGETEWSDLLGLFDDASIYQAWAYGRVRWGDAALSRLVLRRDGEVVAAAQSRIVRTPLIGGGIVYLRWGPMWRRKGRPFEPEIAARMIQALRDEYVTRRGMVLRVVPRVFEHEPEADAVRAAFASACVGRLPSAPAYRTFLLDLRPSLEDLRKGLHKKWRKRLRLAGDEDTQVADGPSDEGFEALIGLYAEMVGRKKFVTSVDPAEFREMQKLLPEPQKMTVIVCRADGQPVAATAFASIGDTGLALIAASNLEGREREASYLAKWRTIELMKGRGLVRLDLGGRDPERAPKVDQFKAGIGAAEATHIGIYQAVGRSPGNRVALLADWLRESYRQLRVIME